VARLNVVRRALADAIRGIDGLDVFHYTPGSVVVPCAYLADVEIEPNFTMGGADDHTFTIRVLTSAADDESGQDLLDELLSRDGSVSIRAALETARGASGQYALDGAADDLNVTRIGAYRQYVEGGGTYFGGEITVRVIGSGNA
jgi:hypothetical protein